MVAATRTLGKSMYEQIIACVLTVLAGAPAVAADEPAVMSVLRNWVKGFNSGDARSAIATCADQTSMIDDFPPHEWHGAGACAKWFSDFQTMSRSEGITDAAIAIGKPTHVEVSAGVAYIVAPTTLTFQRKGKPVKDNGILTVTLQGDASNWRITGWVWSDQ
jgi:ketosteroid isomerase-like protein